MTKRDIVKIAANYAVAGLAESAIESTVENNTDIVVEDNLPVRVGIAVASVYIASRTKPYTSKAVDKIADSWKSRKERKLTVVES
jgi:hypothetical protein